MRPSCLAVVLSILAGSAHAQEPAPPPAPVSEDVRLRIGFALGGGYLFGARGGPSVAGTLRLGVQFNRFLGVLLQLQPNFILADRESLLGTAYGVNAHPLLEVTLFDHLQLGVGPSLDALVEGGCASATCASTPTLRWTGHGRVAVVIGGRNPEGGRRSGFTLSLDLHPLIRPTGPALWLGTVGLGGDWF